MDLKNHGPPGCILEGWAPSGCSGLMMGGGPVNTMRFKVSTVEWWELTGAIQI